MRSAQRTEGSDQLRNERDGLPALQIVGLTVSYGAAPALDGIDLHVRPGSCTGLVGPNGSGKSTTLRSALGLIRPDRGTVRVHGIDALADPIAARRMIGAVLDPLALFERLSAHEMVESLAELRGLGPEVARARAIELFELLGIGGQASDRISGYSHGMRKKTALVAALIHRPRLLLLDEPFEGVDPVSGRAMRAVLERFLAAGGSILLSSHVMEVVERVADHLAVLHDGRVVSAGPTEEILAGRRLEEAFFEMIAELEPSARPADHRGDVAALGWLQ